MCNFHSLEQVQLQPSRGDNILDLVLTNRPSLINSVSLIPGIADHDSICTDIMIKPKYCKQKKNVKYFLSIKLTGKTSRLILKLHVTISSKVTNV